MTELNAADYARRAAVRKHRELLAITMRLVLLVACGFLPLWAQSYPRNATTCDQCHSAPTKFGSSRLTVQRVGSSINGKFVPGVEGGVLHRIAASKTDSPVSNQLLGDRVALNLLGDGYIEA